MTLPQLMTEAAHEIAEDRRQAQMMRKPENRAALMRRADITEALYTALHDLQQHQHVPQIAEQEDGWGVFCAACSAVEGDYAYPCRADPDFATRYPAFIVRSI